MKRLYPSIVATFAIACIAATPAAAIELDGFLAEINVAARADIGSFRADLSTTFKVSSGEIDELFAVFADPADVYISLRIRDLAHVSIERVAAEYRRHEGQGWGVIAKNLGIKPGSAEFHALKQNGFATRASGGPADQPGKGHQGKKK